jgi:hypothetical protein
LKGKKKAYVQALDALQEFADTVDGDYCGQTELDDFIQEKKDEWEESQNTIDENCETLKLEGKHLEKIKGMVSDIDATEAPLAPLASGQICEGYDTRACANGLICQDPTNPGVDVRTCTHVMCICQPQLPPTQGQFCVGYNTQSCAWGLICEDPQKPGVDVDMCAEDYCRCQPKPIVNPCDEGNGGCAQDCQKQGPQLQYAVCRCGYGFKLNADGKACDTVHPCDRGDNGGCAHICNRKGDERVCSCADKFELNANGRTCDPEQYATPIP